MISPDRAWVIRLFDGHSMFLDAPLAKKFDALLNQDAQVFPFGRLLLVPQIAESADKMFSRVGRAQDPLYTGLRLFIVPYTTLNQRSGARHDRDEIVKVMPHFAGQLRDGFATLG